MTLLDSRTFESQTKDDEHLREKEKVVPGREGTKVVRWALWQTST
jgi:hypothetical protein